MTTDGKPTLLADTLTAAVGRFALGPTTAPDVPPTTEEQVRRHLALCGVPERYLDRSFDTFTERTGTKAAIRVAREVAESLDRGLVLTGPVGGGKTHLAVAILRRRIEAWLERWPSDAVRHTEADGHSYMVPRPPLDVRFEVVPSLLDRVRMAIAGPENTDPLTTPRNARLLILDDLGREKSTDWVSERLYVLVNDRYNAKLPTIVTTNSTAAELVERGYDALFSRLIEGAGGAAGMVRLTSSDRRREA